MESAARAPYSRPLHREERRAAGGRPCTAETARCSVAPSYNYDLPECCREHVKNLVFTVGDAMTAAGVRWWLDYGSLLGAVRNPKLGIPGGIVPHDKDADLGFLAEDWPKLLGLVETWAPQHTATDKDNELGQALGFHWIHKLARRRPVERLGEPDGLRHRHHYVGADRCKGREFPEDKLLPLAEVEWEGRMLPCPAGALTKGKYTASWFLEHRYGRAWETPIRRNHDGFNRPGEPAQYGAGDSIKVRISAKNHTNVDIFPWYDRPRGR